MDEEDKEGLKQKLEIFTSKLEKEPKEITGKEARELYYTFDTYYPFGENSYKKLAKSIIQNITKVGERKAKEYQPEEYLAYIVQRLHGIEIVAGEEAPTIDEKLLIDIIKAIPLLKGENAQSSFLDIIKSEKKKKGLSEDALQELRSIKRKLKGQLLKSTLQDILRGEERDVSLFWGAMRSIKEYLMKTREKKKKGGEVRQGKGKLACSTCR